MANAFYELKDELSEAEILGCAKFSVTALRKRSKRVDEILEPYIVRGPDTCFLQKTRGLDEQALIEQGVVKK